MDAAILFESDAYRLDGPKLMGRQAAGNGFLRAAVAAHAGRPIWGYSPYGNAAQDFRRTVLEFDPAGRTEWIARNDLATMAERRVLFRPDGQLAPMAEFRLRAGPASYSLCGLTHTLSGPPMTAFAALPAAALAPWDAIICTSRAAVSVLEQAIGAGEEYFAWRFGREVRAPRPLLPVIPLGVHARDFEFSEADRAAARSLLGLADDEVAVLFAGRLVFHAKAHPYQMLRALQAVYETTGRKIVLVQAGQFPNEAVETAYTTSARDFCPDVRALFINGKDFERYRAAWRAADLFVSLSDNIQETFGITPLEAMASGVPVLVSDWDGYRDTVRDGEDGFRIATYAPDAGHGDHIAKAYESGELNYDFMLFRTCLTVSVDFPQLVDRLGRLIDDPDLRRRMGEAGRERVRSTYDWSHVYRRYQELWDELDAIRTREAAAAPDYWARAPRNAPGQPDPFRVFAGFPTARIGPDTRVALAPGGSADAYLALEGHPVFPHWKVAPDIVRAAFARLAEGEASIAELSVATTLQPSLMVEVVGRFLKMNLVQTA
ncbi:glycosyl transferase, group 1 [Phenylobacterium zucineum HLK1]|uniref:Glycosyl transferase, group 1 n=1 Tax=Phenylobacterium zucineum (strain HLK1) TaxID=450851 RepID=B4REE1_PHEZH|nr:glycosyltransferase family 4 protein [Phenylobacterium zucineum]ACG76883.1 glycosyl transferase, group 1 [Phenylobacterium zucineum HLK1]